MFFSFLTEIIKNMLLTGSYSNNVFPDPLEKEEEKMYIERHLLGDKEARNKLIEHNLRLVAHIVKKYEKKQDDVDDLISIGTIGLIKGVDTFSKKHDTRITTYCARCIENVILTHWKSI
ncbi:MAG TPA: sigma-70 family RNA polymerase sigma factor [Mollicutes bacterium]|nr:sigma-70 family RNA polymerase sigma factor [Mollicutes bacterium]